MRQNQLLQRLTLLSKTSVLNASTSTVPSNVQVFDRKMKRRQRNWAVNSPNFDHAKALREECGYRIADRVFDLTKFNEVCVDLGSGVGYIAPHLIKENVGTLFQCDMSDEMIKKGTTAPELEVSCLNVIIVVIFSFLFTV